MAKLWTLLTILLGCSLAVPAEGTSVDGIKLHWTARGEGAAIVFVHGWTCDSSVWEVQLAELGTRHRVIALDLPGHGKSASPADREFSYELYARAIEAVRDEVRAGRIVLVGHSMGVSVVRQYALRYPGRVAALVGVDGSFRLPMNPQAEADESEQAWRELSREEMIRAMFVAETPAALQARILALMLSTPDEMAEAVAAPMQDPSAVSAAVLDVPVLLVWSGTRDRPDIDWMRQFVPQVELEVIAGTGHFLMMEKPAAFNRRLRDFLADIDF